MDAKETILLGTMEAFHEKGLKFTMDDVAKKLNISKKTLYKVFDNKEDLFLAMVDYLFDSIKESKLQVLAREDINTVDKIRMILSVMPESYANLDFRTLYQLKEKYPSIYEQVERRLENGWEETLSLMEQGMQEGVIRTVPLCLVKLMMEAALEQFFQRDILVQNGLSYQEALSHVVEILVDGIAVR